MAPNFGHTIDETTLKRGLRELNTELHFDMAAGLGLWHPRIDEWQGVLHAGRHIASMSRGVLPEYTVYAMNDQNEITHVLRIGWRTTLHEIVKANVPGVTWSTLCQKFGVGYKHYKEHQPTERIA